jgi:hypothetical protein
MRNWTLVIAGTLVATVLVVLVVLVWPRSATETQPLAGSISAPEAQLIWYAMQRHETAVGSGDRGGTATPCRLHRPGLDVTATLRRTIPSLSQLDGARPRDAGFHAGWLAMPSERDTR